jgi:hypothetical protein
VLIGGEDGVPGPLVAKLEFDTAAGKEEVLARVGRSELAALGTCRTYVAQQQYAQQGHDGKPPVCLTIRAIGQAKRFVADRARPEAESAW